MDGLREGGGEREEGRVGREGEKKGWREGEREERGRKRWGYVRKGRKKEKERKKINKDIDIDIFIWHYIHCVS